MTTPTKAQQMAKSIAWETVLRVNGTVRENMEAAALAAIIETQEACAELVEGRNSPHNTYADAEFNEEIAALAAAIREGASQ